MNRKLTTLTLACNVCTAHTISAASADHSHHHSGHDHTRPDSHAPIGVMGDHLMREGETMLTYRYMHMNMDGNRTGTDRVDVPLPDYMVSPTRMTMGMHMLSGMYAPSDKLTLAVMLPFTSISMDHIRNMDGLGFTTESSGIGDVKLASVYGLYARPGRDLMLNFAISAPTGSIDERDDIPTLPTPSNAHLPYPMQLGSGTWDIIPGLTYVQLYDRWSWGLQGLYTIRTGTNDNGYSLGNRLDLSAWIAKKIAPSTSLSFRLNGQDWGNIDGADTKLLPMPTVPTKDPNLRGGTRIDALAGVNFVLPALQSLRLAAEAGVPVYQDLDGPQLEADLVFTLGAQFTF
jgi:hypothetical protein